ncbi:MAG: hypothetical protein Q9216_003128 [Gyalolechia sp. 2 TL-2023]
MSDLKKQIWDLKEALADAKVENKTQAARIKEQSDLIRQLRSEVRANDQALSQHGPAGIEAPSYGLEEERTNIGRSESTPRLNKGQRPGEDTERHQTVEDQSYEGNSDSSSNHGHWTKRLRTAQPRSSGTLQHRESPSASSRQQSSSSNSIAGASQKMSTTTIAQPDRRSEKERWHKVEEVRSPSFSYGGLPQAVFEMIRNQMTNPDGWDARNPKWANGTTAGDPKCANSFVYKRGSHNDDGYACDDCTRRHLVCVAVKQGLVRICPLRPEDRGQATKKDMAYWVLERETP